MRWRDQQESQNVEDERGDAGGGFSFPGGGAARSGGIGIIGFLILLGLSLFFGIDPRTIFEGTSGPVTEGDSNFPDIRLPHSQIDQTGVPVPRTNDHQVQSPQTTSEDDRERFVSVVLRDTEDVWTDLFKQYGTTYTNPKLVLFDGSIRSACGNAMSVMGPFYCPEDEKVYLDLSFFRELKDRFHAPGDFAQAYVIAHEVGHHVQKLLGIADQVEAARQGASEKKANALQVRMELQADCFAGVWANHAQDSKNIIEPGDIDAALGAASAIGDDRVQKQSQGYVVPDSFTHGSSAQRVGWFRRGYESGKIENCDTFNASQL